MSTGPFQSKLEPHRSEIAEWRAQQPPLTYAQIAVLLKVRHQLAVRPETIFRFVKVRSRRSIYRMTVLDEHQSHQEGRTKVKTSGKVPPEVQARLAAIKQQPAATEQANEPFLPPDGRLTFKRKTTT